MNTLRTIEGHLSASGQRHCIVASRFNGFIVDHLIGGAIDALVRHGVDPGMVDLVKAPGAFELPLVLDKVAATGRYDAIIAVGAVIRGATPHFDYVAGECVKGLSGTALRHGIPIAFGVLTVDTIEQAVERAGTKAGNKGAEAAMSAIEMVNLLRSLEDA